MRKAISGFTMIELLVVVAVIGILSTIGVVAFTKIQTDSRDSQRSSSVTVISEALEKYYQQNGEYPSCAAMKQSATIIKSSVLEGINTSVLATPTNNSTDNSITTCANLTSGPGLDVFAYVGDGSEACLTGNSCLSYSLKYREEATGDIISVDSRHTTDIATSGVPVLNATPAGYSQVNLTWSAVTNAASYTVQYATNSGFSSGLVAQSVTGTSLSIPGLTSGMTYYFRVLAVNGSSVSGWSNVKSIMINFTTLTWKENVSSGLRNWYGATLSDDGTKMAATSFNGYIYTSADSGVTWTERTSSGIRPWYYIASSADGTKLIAAAATDWSGTVVPSAVYTSTNSGATWTKRTVPGVSTSVAISSDGTKMAAAADSINTSIDSGVTWTNRSPNASGGWGDVTSSPNGTVLSAKQGTNIYISTNSGATWVARPAFIGGMFAISADGTKLVTGSSPGYIYTSTNSGATWTQRTAAGSRYWWRFTSSSDGTKLVAFDSSPGYIYTSVDSGVTWTAQTVAGSTYRQGIDSTPDGSKIIVGPSYGSVYTGVYSP